MNRSDFLKMSALLGLAIPAPGLLTGCRKPEPENPCIAPLDEGEHVVIIGAGPAGLTAGYLLAQLGIRFTILEAGSTFGGRTRTNTAFADFPIPLGAEWLHVEEDIFSEIVNDPTVNVEQEMIAYNPDEDYALYNGQQLELSDLGLEIDQKFLNSSWWDFFATYIVPTVADRIIYNAPVTAIDYSTDEVKVTAGQSYTGERVIVTVPVKILQDGDIEFSPALPQAKLNALDQVNFWDGHKGFIEFSEQFWPAFSVLNVSPFTAGDKLYYDASYGQNSEMHILGLFGVGAGTLPYVNLNEEDRIAYILEELDELFDGQATPNYVNHLFQHWQNEPYAKGAYLTQYTNPAHVATLGEPIQNKVFFAGDGYTDGSDYSAVHTAARAAKTAVEAIVG